MDAFHDNDNKITIPLMNSIDDNIRNMEILFDKCSDYVSRKMQIGKLNKVWIYIAYTDNMVDRNLLEYSVIKNLYHLTELPLMDQYSFIKENAIQTADTKDMLTMDETAESVLSGDVAVFIDGCNKVLNISFKSFPGRGVSETELEVTIKGAKDSFTESIALNKVLIRRRIKDTNLKMESFQVGVRSRTGISLAYIKGIVKDELIDEIKSQINEYTVDGIFDIGMLEQLAGADWKSPFPKYQSTERPDKASSALLEGRIAVLVDNSPMVLLLPVDISVFFQAADDYYRSWQAASFIRIIRYIGILLSIGLPGIYIAVVNYQPELIPTPLILSLAADRQGVPFTILFEVILLQLAFEMLSEAGIRLPSPMGNTIGIVGGLIIGDAAISANLVSPMVVIVVAFTAISSFVIPNETFTTAFRIIRYIIILLSALLGLYGFVLGMMVVCIHLAGLKSFGVPYLSPFASTDRLRANPLSDSILKFPLTKLWNRPIYAKEDEKVRVKRQDGAKL